MKQNNIMENLNILVLNMPQNISPLEKLRWIYIKAGELFSYDYTVVNGNYESKINYDKDYINNYQTCIEISDVMNLIYNNIDESITSKVINRQSNIRGRDIGTHKANLVQVEKDFFILDLTLDLYLIQSGCRTKEFGFTQSINGNEDIISLRECEEMDKKLGLLKGEYYTDKKIQDVKSILGNFKFNSFEEEINEKMKQIKLLIPNFNGFHEGKSFINKLLKEIICKNYKEYNLHNNNEMISCFKIFDDDNYIWYMYNPEIGLLKTSELNIKTLIDNGWQTRSNSLIDEIENKKVL